ncbi:MAG: citramalate synthase [Ruminococcaceae bacterium]|nr:citramalate synthase [Oscillospiraceae bacterium]
MKIEIFDTTLRDGAQGAGINFNYDDKIKVIHALDEIGVSYIEAGMLCDAQSAEFFSELGKLSLTNSKLCAFTQTRRAMERCENDLFLPYVAKAPVPCAVVYGKSWLYQVSNVLGTTAEENLAMIADTVRYLHSAGKEVIFDAEHFFDGYADNAEYSLRVVDAALKAGASRVVLCDTNGGMLPDVVGMITKDVVDRFGSIGIHCHNDMGMAEACSVSAVLSGAVQVHGTISGIGERCGNANLNTLIPVLQLKLGFDCIGDRIKKLTKTARFVNETANLAFSENEPFVGGYAFTHKAGAHIDGVNKSPKTFEHISPEAVGNKRNILISGLSGRAAVIEKLRELIVERCMGSGMEEFAKGLADGTVSKNDPVVVRAAEMIKAKEAEGYSYEDAGASLALVLDEAFGIRRRSFDLLNFKVIVDEDGEGTSADEMRSWAMIKISVDGNEELSAGEGNGPVNAMDVCLRRALSRFYPEIGEMHLSDYKVRVLNSGATASVVRVLIESTDGVSVWRTIGVSSDIINASWQALRDSVEYMLSRHSSGAESQR